MRDADLLVAVEEFTHDKSTPPKARAEVADWLTRFHHADRLAALLRADGTRARQALTDAKQAAPDRLVAALAAGPVDPETIGSDLSALRYSLDLTEDRYAIASRARVVCHEHATRRAFRAHRDDLLRWIAAERVSTAWWEPVADRVAVAWSAIGSGVRVQLPYEAVMREGDDGRIVPTPTRDLDLNLGAWSGRESLPIDRAWFAWSALASGDYRVVSDTRGMLTLFRLRPGLWCRRSCSSRSLWSGSGCCGQG